MSTPRSMLVLAVLIVACLRGDALPRSVGGAEPAGASAAAEPRPVLPDGREVIWVDEFDGTRLDRSSWEAYHGTYGDGNGEAACLTPGNVEVSGGILRITARKARTACRGGDVRHYSSGFLGSREVGRYHPLFARYEVRARVPYGQGL